MSDRMSFAALAPLFRYPHAIPSAPQLFASEVASLPLAELQSLYTSTFDLAPSCTPYLGVHLFGEEPLQRARLMAGLRKRYARTSDELPDHIAEVLEFAPHYDDDEWRELVSLVLAPAVRKMNAILAPTSNPYRHLIAAVAALTEGGHS